MNLNLNLREPDLRPKVWFGFFLGLDLNQTSGQCLKCTLACVPALLSRAVVPYHAWSGAPSATTDECTLLPARRLATPSCPRQKQSLSRVRVPKWVCGMVVTEAKSLRVDTDGQVGKVLPFVCDTIFVCCCHERRRSCTLLFVHDAVCVPLLMSAAIRVHCDSCTVPFVCAAVRVCCHLSALLLVRATVHMHHTCHD